MEAVWLSLATALAFLLPMSTHAQNYCPTLFNFYAHATDCTKFYRCVWGVPITFDCPVGTHWNQLILACDHAYNVPCPGDILKPIYKLLGNDGFRDNEYEYLINNNRPAVHPTYDAKHHSANTYYEKDTSANKITHDAYPTAKHTDTRPNVKDVTKLQPTYTEKIVPAKETGAYVRRGGRRSDLLNHDNSKETNQYEHKDYWSSSRHETEAPGHNYGGFQAMQGYNKNSRRNGYAQIRRYINTNPAYGGYNAGGYASRAASGYAKVGDPIVGRVFGTKW